MRAWETGEDYQELLRNDLDVRRHLDDEALRRCFDPEHHLRNVDRILQRALEAEEDA
jgi:adenylosuccinate lyase